MLMYCLSLLFLIFNLIVPDSSLPQVEVVDLVMNRHYMTHVDLLNYHNLSALVTPSVHEYNWRTPFNLIRFVHASNPATIQIWTPSPELLASLNSVHSNSSLSLSFLNNISSPHQFMIMNISCWLIFGTISSL